MNARAIEKLLWGLLAAACLLHLVAWADTRERNYEFLPDMVAAVPYETQARNPVFEDGKTLQRPPAGTFPRGHLPLRSGGLLLDTTTKWEELSAEQQQAWETLTPGWTLDESAEAAALERGRKVFVAFCATCHGGGGAGDGVVTTRGVPPPPSLLADNARNLSDARIFRILTVGRGNMASYATQIEREDRWKALRYVRKLQSQK